MSRSIRIFLILGGLVFGSLGSWFILDQINNPSYDIIAILIGLFFLGIGLFNFYCLCFYERIEHFENNKRKKFLVKRFFQIFGTIFLIPLIVLFFNEGINSESELVAETGLEYITVTTSKKPRFKKGAKSSTSLYLFTNEYPDFQFEPFFNRYVHNHTTFEFDVNPDDTLILGILKNDYKKKIIKTKKPNFAERHINYSFIETFYIEKNGNVYYSPQVHNTLEKEDHKLAPFIGIPFGLIFLSCLIAIWLTNIVEFLQGAGFPKTANILLKLRKKKIL